MIVRRRSMLYLPGSSQRMMAKAGSRGADVVVLDLEDEITKGALLTHQGKITNDAVRESAESRC